MVISMDAGALQVNPYAMALTCCATWPAGQGSVNVQQEGAPGPKMFCCCGSAQEPQMNPFQQSTVMVVMLHDRPQPGARVGDGGIGVGDEVFVMVAVFVAVGERVLVGLRVAVWEIVFVFHEVQVTVRVTGHVIVGVGDTGAPQQTDTSA